MASAVACKGAAPASLLKSGAPVAFCALHSPADRRPYNTQVKEVGRYDDDDYSGRDLVIPSFFSQDVLDPHSAPTSMARLLSLMETGLSSIAGASRLGRWVAKEDDNAGADATRPLLISQTSSLPAPAESAVADIHPCLTSGLQDTESSDDIRGCCDKALQILCAHYGWDVRLEFCSLNILMIKGEGEKQPWDGDDDSAVPRYNRRMEMPADVYKINKIKAEMKNGILWVTLLKVEEEERKSVFHVKVE
nr:26.2 kDa heat shock protein, mitochondrial-like [Aegilops tauschii subsp. strangulata]